MERNKAIGLALIIAGVAGGVIYYMYVMKKPAPATPEPTPTPTPGKTAVRGMADKLSVPKLTTGIGGRLSMGAIQAASVPLSSGTETGGGSGSGTQYSSVPQTSGGGSGVSNRYNVGLYQGNLSR